MDPVSLKLGVVTSILLKYVLYVILVLIIAMVFCFILDPIEVAKTILGA